ncbi:iron-sulfur cluster assembly scaffold protein [Sphingomonas hankyongi]|uniref:Iron-sulfur cluster assembly scaffold protein n=1 Tax=Sphingomonas hankyongi TaxID=2908209 RepID=A0ABT0S123_9SPHN|nr:iron-sulfur cluster assembly scaffold protein [Sphingomonas hankyongi]MCL6729555.1 iron-sulfur cluster assembly scaffold protein [Sphingomonas hankyongi]
MTPPLYTTEILRLAASLQEPRELERADGRAEVRSATCGSKISLTVQLDEDRRVLAITQTVQACAFGQASAALVEHHATGRSHAEVADAMLAVSRWLCGHREDSGDWPGLMALEPARTRQPRHGAILLPFRALLAAMEDAR